MIQKLRNKILDRDKESIKLILSKELPSFNQEINELWGWIKDENSIPEYINHRIVKENLKKIIF